MQNNINLENAIKVVIDKYRLPDIKDQIKRLSLDYNNHEEDISDMKIQVSDINTIKKKVDTLYTKYEDSQSNLNDKMYSVKLSINNLDNKISLMGQSINNLSKSYEVGNRKIDKFSEHKAKTEIFWKISTGILIVVGTIVSGFIVNFLGGI